MLMELTNMGTGHCSHKIFCKDGRSDRMVCIPSCISHVDSSSGLHHLSLANFESDIFKSIIIPLMESTLLQQQAVTCQIS
jgi:hypothetical protein